MRLSTFLPSPSQLLFRAAEKVAGVRPGHFELRDKSVLITGGSRGLGLEIARVMVAKGRTWCWSRGLPTSSTAP